MAGIQNSIRQEIEWLAVTGDAVHGRIRGMSLREAQHAAQHLFPEFEGAVQILGRVAATARQLHSADAAPLITPKTLRQAGIQPLGQIQEAAGRRADRFMTQRMQAWAAKHPLHAAGDR